MALPTINISKSGKLTVEVFVGEAHFGTYDLWLWNKEGTKKTKLGEGVNADDIPDVLDLPGTGQELDGKILHWRIRVAPLAPGPGQKFSATVTVRQKGQAVAGGQFLWSDSIGAAPIEIEGGARLEL